MAVVAVEVLVELQVLAEVRIAGKSPLLTRAGATPVGIRQEETQQTVGQLVGYGVQRHELA